VLGRVPIRVSAPLVVGIPVLALGLSLSLLWNRQSRSAVEDLADRNIGHLHDLIATRVEDVLAAPIRVCRVNAHLVESGRLDPDDPASWRPTLIEQAAAFPTLSAIAWGHVDGRAAWVSRYGDGSFYWALEDDPDRGPMREWRLAGDGTISEEPTSTFDFDLRTRPWFRGPLDAEAPRWSEPYLWVGGVDSDGATLGLSYGIPVRGEDGSWLSVVDADFSLDDLSRYLRTVRVGETGTAALVATDGGLIAVSDGTAVVAEGRRLAAIDSPSPLVAAAARAADPLPPALMEIEATDHLVRASSVGEEAGLDWRLFTIVPESDFLAGIESGRRHSWTVSLLAVALAGVVGLVAARWLTTPLVTLVGAVRRIGGGDLDTTVRLDRAPEYARLSDEINAMTAGLRDRMRMRRSLSLAMEVQRNLLPATEPRIPGLDIAGHSTYCDETGGDYYDFLDVSGTDDRTAVIALGDVMGHGVAAAMLMATARGILRSRCAVAGSLGDFLEHLNGMLVTDTRGERFMTMLLVTIDASSRELRWATAGHGPPILYVAADDRFPELGGGSLPLGLVDGESYDEEIGPSVAPGDIVIAATDGLWETRGPDGTLYGMERLRELVRGHADRSAEEIGRAIRDALDRHRGPNEPDDDLTFVIVKVTE